MVSNNMATELQTKYQETRKEVKEYISSLKRNSFRKKVEVNASYLIRKIESYNVNELPDMLEYVAYEIDKLGALVKK